MYVCADRAVMRMSPAPVIVLFSLLIFLTLAENALGEAARVRVFFCPDTPRMFFTLACICHRSTGILLLEINASPLLAIDVDKMRRMNANLPGSLEFVVNKTTL